MAPSPSPTCPLSLSKPVFEHHPGGLGISHRRPRLSWKFLTPDDHQVPLSWTQTAYEVEITRLPTYARPQPHTQTYHVKSADSVLVPWPAPALQSREAASVRIRAYGSSAASPIPHDDAKPTAWSEPATVELGLLDREDWSASFITAAARLGPEAPLRPLRFRKEFVLPSHYGASASQSGTGLRAVEGRLYITSLGVFNVYINGKLASDECLAPGWTSYKHRLVYRSLDVSSLVNTECGAGNVIAVEVAEGWYATVLGFRGGSRFNYGGRELAVMAQLEVTLGDPEQPPWTLVTDESWDCFPSPILRSELYNGEVYDMREEQRGWNQVQSATGASANLACRGPTKALATWPTERLVSPDAPPVRVIETLRPVNTFKSTKTGKLILDFGQNLAGKLLFKSLSLPAGASVTFTHAEVMEHGEIGTRPLNLARCSDTVISSGEVLENWTPKFTFHGFRYVQVEVTGAHATFDVESLLGLGDDDGVNILALVMHSDIRRRGFFECSNDSINQLHRNVVWSMRGNFLSIPTDCPQRDERLGWTGDIQVFCPTASFLYDTVGFLSSWLEDLAAEQLLEDWRDGVPALVCPDIPLPDWPRRIPQALWHDVTVLTPHVLHLYSGDREVLDRQFESMQAWLDRGVDRQGGGGLWNPDRWQLGDWLDPTAPPDQPGYSRTDSVMVADACLVHVTSVFAQVCSILGKSNLTDRYGADALRLRSLFQHKYMTPAGNLMGSTQTGLSLAICFSLYRGASDEPQKIASAGRALSKLVRAAKFRIGTGFAGTPLITHALTLTAQPQLAYRMLVEKSCPSWMYPVTMGATTVWERWDSMLPDGSINPGHMTSFNHYALGAVADWLHGTVGGIAPVPASPGWKVFQVKPVPGGNLTWAKTRFDGPYGEIRCEWRWSSDSGVFNMSLIVPPNSTALVTLPSDQGGDFSQSSNEEQGEAPGTLVGSGFHQFECLFKAGEWPPKPILSPQFTWRQDSEDLAV